MKVMGNVVLRPAPRIDSARAGWLAQQAAHSVTHGHQSHRTALDSRLEREGLIDKTDRQDLDPGLFSAGYCTNYEIRSRIVSPMQETGFAESDVASGASRSSVLGASGVSSI